MQVHINECQIVPSRYGGRISNTVDSPAEQSRKDRALIFSRTFSTEAEFFSVAIPLSCMPEKSPVFACYDLGSRAGKAVS